MDLPVTSYVNNKGEEVEYLTSNEVTEIIIKAVRKVYLDMQHEDIMKYSAHSIRVWARVSLDKAGNFPAFTKERLSWMGKSYCVYVRDINKTNHQHLKALKESSQAGIDLIDTYTDSNIEPLIKRMPKHLEIITAGTENIPPLLSIFSICNQWVNFYKM